jgi:hypothetical protein
MNSEKAQFNPSQPPKEYNIPDHWHDEAETEDTSSNSDNLDESLEIQSATILDEPATGETTSPPVTGLNLPLEIQSATILDEPATVEISNPETNLDEPLEVESLTPLNLATNTETEATAEQSLEDIFSPSEMEETGEIKAEVSQLQKQKQTLEAEIKALEIRKNQLVSAQVIEVQETLNRMIKEGLKELEQRKQSLEIAIEQLERRRERIREEMRTTFAGVSQDLAIRIQGFKEYLVGSLQDLAATADQLELPNFEDSKQSQSQPQWEQPRQAEPVSQAISSQFTASGFQSQASRIRELLDQYRTRPDYYGPAWQLRRTFEPIHAERVQNWFFSQGGRGAIRSMGSRLQNILVASAIASVLSSLQGNRFRVLVLANTPERLGEWRRGLQDCLGISRSDFGPDRGVVLFESPEALIQKADRLVEEKNIPLVILDETEDRVNLSLLQFPLWLAFAPEPQQMSTYLY